MKILLAHNSYQQQGGEDVVFHAEKELLKTHGHTIIDYQRSNYETGAVKGALWSQQSYREIRNLIQETRPDLAHFHNTFFAISPSAYYACQNTNLPVIQTLHNFRLVCPGALLLRNGKPCEDCLGRKIAWPGVVHACWRGSRAGSALTASMLSLHHALGTWQHKVNHYIALSEFARQKFIQGGLPAEKITIKPNFLPDPNIKKEGPGNYALFIGRLSPEKGLGTLMEAWQGLHEIPLKIIGTGSLFDTMKSQIINKKLHHIDMTGNIDHKKIFPFLQNARFLIVPSESYETFGLTIIEAFAMQLPVIVSILGNLKNLVKEHETGLHFIPGSPQDLAEKAAWLWQNPQEAARMGQNARHEYEEKYTPENNYRQLMAIYKQALEEKKR